ncbi:MAG: hypothetical protein ACRDD2_10435 [Sarcina sp.]
MKKINVKKIIVAMCGIAILPTITVFASERTQSATAYFSSGSKENQCFVDLENANHRISMNGNTQGKRLYITMRENIEWGYDRTVTSIDVNTPSAQSGLVKTKGMRHYLRYEAGNGGGYAMIAH